jgi:DUF1365 family protein
MVTAPSTGHALYVGRLRHRRFRPTPHAFTYPLFMAMLDIDRLDEAAAHSRWVSRNRFNWATIDDRDHVGDPALPLRTRLTRQVAAQGIALPDGPIHLLTHLRYLGYAFNPISFYYCFDHTNTLGAVVAEVNSTFGEQALYVLPGINTPHGVVRHRTAKTMHVSPFNEAHLDYDFTVTAPGQSLVAHMTTIDRTEAGTRPFFDATLTLERQPWDASHLHRALRRHPWMTASVIGAIHYQALRLWWKGVRYVPHPLTPAERRTKRQQEAGT